MVEFILSVLPLSSSVWVADRLDTLGFSSPLSVPCLIWNDVFFEAETGLKRSLKPLIRRFKKYRKFFFLGWSGAWSECDCEPCFTVFLWVSTLLFRLWRSLFC